MAMTPVVSIPFVGPNGSTTFTDTTGNTTWVGVGDAQIQGNALVLDGSGDYIWTNTVPFRLGPWDFRISFKMKQPPGSSYKLILDHISTSAGPIWTWQIYTINGVLHWNVYHPSFGNPSPVTSVARVDDDVQHDIVIERIAGVITMYVDSVAVSTAADTRSYEALSKMGFGARIILTDSFYYYTGTLDDLLIEIDLPEFNGRLSSWFLRSDVGWDRSKVFDWTQRSIIYNPIDYTGTQMQSYVRVTRGVPAWWGPTNATSQLPTYRLRGRVMQRDPDGVLDDWPLENVRVALFFRRLHTLIDIQRSDADGYVEFKNLMPGNQAYYGIAIDLEAPPMQNSIIWDRLTPEPGA